MTSDFIMTSYFRYATSYCKIMAIFGFSVPSHVYLVNFGRKIKVANFSVTGTQARFSFLPWRRGWMPVGLLSWNIFLKLRTSFWNLEYMFLWLTVAAKIHFLKAHTIYVKYELFYLKDIFQTIEHIFKWKSIYLKFTIHIQSLQYILKVYIFKVSTIYF